MFAHRCREVTLTWSAATELDLDVCCRELETLCSSFSHLEIAKLTICEVRTGGQPSTMHPTEAQWLSPKVVTRKRVPNVDMAVVVGFCRESVRCSSWTQLIQLVLNLLVVSVVQETNFLAVLIVLSSIDSAGCVT